MRMIDHDVAIRISQGLDFNTNRACRIRCASDNIYENNDLIHVGYPVGQLLPLYKFVNRKI